MSTEVPQYAPLEASAPLCGFFSAAERKRRDQEANKSFVAAYNNLMKLVQPQQEEGIETAQSFKSELIGQILGEAKRIVTIYPSHTSLMAIILAKVNKAMILWREVQIGHSVQPADLTEAKCREAAELMTDASILAMDAGATSGALAIVLGGFGLMTALATGVALAVLNPITLPILILTVGVALATAAALSAGCGYNVVKAQEMNNFSNRLFGYAK